jgi:SAM-dependent methyltransferase
MLRDGSAREVDHYASVGEGAVELMSRALGVVGRSWSDVGAVLDFGSGHGRVTRWLVAAVVPGAISVFDVDRDGPAFCAREFGVRVVPDRGDWRTASLETYDVIWLGSVITHLTRDDARKLLGMLAERLRPRGALVVTTHGDEAIRRNAAGFYGATPSALQSRVEHDYRTTGFSFVPYKRMPSYGTTWMSESYVEGLVAGLTSPALRIAAFWPAAWDRHQDVVVITTPS